MGGDAPKEKVYGMDPEATWSLNQKFVQDSELNANQASLQSSGMGGVTNNWIRNPNEVAEETGALDPADPGDEKPGGAGDISLTNPVSWLAAPGLLAEQFGSTDQDDKSWNSRTGNAWVAFSNALVGKGDWKDVGNAQRGEQTEQQKAAEEEEKQRHANVDLQGFSGGNRGSGLGR